MNGLHFGNKKKKRKKSNELVIQIKACFKIGLLY